MHTENQNASKVMYNHAEAFKIMRYECENCHSISLGWNSRDGVTPYTINSPCCGNNHSATHTMRGMHHSRDYPKHFKISFVFVDRTIGQAEHIANEFFERHGKKMMADYPHIREMGKKKFIQEKTDNLYGNGNQPHVLTDKEYREMYLKEHPNQGYKFDRRAFNGLTASDNEVQKARIYGKPFEDFVGHFKLNGFKYKGVSYVTSAQQVSIDNARTKTNDR